MKFSIAATLFSLAASAYAQTTATTTPSTGGISVVNPTLGVSCFENKQINKNQIQNSPKKKNCSKLSSAT